MSKNQLRHWRRSDSFRDVLNLVRTDRLSAFTVLASSLSSPALDTLERLLTSPNGAHAVAGLKEWIGLLLKGQAEETDEITKNVFNILQLRGEISPDLLDNISPQRRRLAERLRVVDAN